MQPFPITAEHADKTLAAVLRELRPDQSWNQVRRLIHTRHAQINGELCLDPGAVFTREMSSSCSSIRLRYRDSPGW